MDLAFRGLPPNARVTMQRVDEDHSSVLKAYAAMGSPLDPTPAQVEQLSRETALGAPKQTQLQNGKLRLTVTPDALVLVKVAAAQ